jgi:hypothetical protein
MRLSKYVKVNKDVLLEYVYDDNNNISDPYQILVNGRDNSYSYIAGSSSSTKNIQSNQLFQIDPVTNNYGLVNVSNYSFLQMRDYPAGFPTRHDTIRIHLPINYVFGEYLGCYVRIYSLDIDNRTEYDYANFYFDETNIDQSYLLNYTSPPLLFQEKLWGKNISFDIPSPHAVAAQISNGSVKANSINFNLTNGVGMSQTAPVFIEFSFLSSKRTINGITTFYLSSPYSTSVPQAPDFEKLGVRVQHSANGDFFEIFGTYNGTISEFNTFIRNSVSLGNRYYVKYQITLFEQNIRGKSLTIVVTDNFNESQEYRPIIKYSTTTAIIDVEMSLIDSVDDSIITRRASYGMLQDEVAKYSLNLTKINIANANKPKIYNMKTTILPSVNMIDVGSQSPVQKIDNIVLAYNFNVVAKSESVRVGSTSWYGMGKLLIDLNPFDNVMRFKIAKVVEQTKPNTPPQPQDFDLTSYGEIKFVVRNSNTSVEAKLFVESNEVRLSEGVVVFKIPGSRMSDVKKVYDTGINTFYITGTTIGGVTVVYSGLFRVYDSPDNVKSLNTRAVLEQDSVRELEIIQTQSASAATANQTGSATQSNPVSAATSVKSTQTIFVNNTYYSFEIQSDSSLKISAIVNASVDYSLVITSSDIRKKYGIPLEPKDLKFEGMSGTDGSLYSSSAGLAIRSLQTILNDFFQSSYQRAKLLQNSQSSTAASAGPGLSGRL